MFALRLNFVDVVCDDSLRNIYAGGNPVGFQFQVRLSYYRGHYLSTIDELSVKVDGKEYDIQDITLCLKGQDYGVSQLHSAVTDFWPITEPATIKVFCPGGLDKGKHKVDFTMYFRSPYMEIGPRSYMPIDSCGEKELVLR